LGSLPARVGVVGRMLTERLDLGDARGEEVAHDHR
jgi:hypothetical protein